MCSMNMTWSNLLSVQETIIYKPQPGASQTRTQQTQQAKITALCGGWQRIRNNIEEFTAGRFAENAAKGKEGFEMVLEMSRKVFAQERAQRMRLEARL